MSRSAKLLAITKHISQKSETSRQSYLADVAAMASRPPGADRLGCANVAHAVAAAPPHEKFKILQEKAPTLAIVTAYNDVLSAHAPYAPYPEQIKARARFHGASAVVAGGVPAMCDGVTQGTPGMELSLFSRDAIAMATAVALSHDIFDGALMLGICDKIVPGLLIGALHFGHLPTIFVPAGPMKSGLSNGEKSLVREQYAQGKVNRAALLSAESAAYHDVGTCTFYGTANSNQMLMEAMGLHVPGAAFAPPQGELRHALTDAAVDLVLANSRQPGDLTLTNARAPIGKVVNERCIVNAMVALLATGGSTNHLIHWVAVARAAGIVIDWDDFSALSDIVPLLCRIYPNGEADVNEFQASGGPSFVIGQLLSAGLLHDDVLTASPGGLADYGRVPVLRQNKLVWDAVTLHPDDQVVRPASDPFSLSGGLRLLTGPLGRSVIKISSVPTNNHVVQAPAAVFDSQEELLAAFADKTLHALCEQHGGVVCVVRWQGPRANGMPELHKLTPPLAVLQHLGYKVALVTDGRMSGASGKVPAAIHMSPEAAMGGALAKVKNGDVICLDAHRGTLEILNCPDFDSRLVATMPLAQSTANGYGLGRGLFTASRQHCTTSEEGACIW
jgi:phosphogluconate dehydratase